LGLGILGLLYALMTVDTPSIHQYSLPISSSSLTQTRERSLKSKLGVKVKSKISHELFSTPYDEATVPFTDLSGSRGKHGSAFWKSHKPSYTCPGSLLSRVGKEKGDGGKWMCGLETFGKLTHQDQYPCVFYSFGISKDSSFESEVLQRTTCSVYAYDMTVPKIGKPLEPSDPRVHFHKMGLSGSNADPKKKTLKTLMKENWHGFIDILKIDVEGEEFPTFEKIFKDFPHDQLPFGQLMIELHNNAIKPGGRGWVPVKESKTLDLVEQLEKRGFRVFSIEPNVRSIQHCSEYSFINL